MNEGKHDIFKNLLNSFDTQKKGFSARKLTAFTFVLFSGYIHVRYLNITNCIEALLIDCGVVLVSLGIITAQNIISFKNGTPTPQNETTK